MTGTALRRRGPFTRVLRLVAAVLLGLLPFMARPAMPKMPHDEEAESTAARYTVGERVVFKVEWNPPWYLFFLPTMEAGEAELRVAGISTFRDRPALKITFDARSSGTLVKLAGVRIDDHFEFFTDPETLCTQGVTKRLWEGKRRRSIDVLYEPAGRRLHIKEVDTGVFPPKVKKDKYVENIPECVKDLFSALFFVRQGDFFDGATYRSVVGDNDSIKEVEARVEKKEWVDTPAGRFEAWRVNTVAVLGGLFKEGGQFRIWLTADERRVPVQFEAKASLGTVQGKLRLLER